jgi:hypothetical protein
MNDIKYDLNDGYVLIDYYALAHADFVYDCRFDCYRKIITNSLNSVCLYDQDFVEISCYQNGRTLNGETIKIHFYDSTKENFISNDEYYLHPLYPQFYKTIQDLKERKIIVDK